MTDDTKPDYRKCVMIATSRAQHEMIMPSLIDVLSPIIIAIIFGVAGVLGLLGNVLSTGFILALFLSNSGSPWDIAKTILNLENLVENILSNFLLEIF